MHWIAVERNPLGYHYKNVKESKVERKKKLTEQVEVSDSDLNILVDAKVSMGQKDSIGSDKASKNSVS